MITGMHAVFFSNESDALRAFLKDTLELPNFDAGGGWPIFQIGDAELGVHPTEDRPPSGTHDVSFVCDDIHATIADLKAKGVEFLGPLEEESWGSVIRFEMPGGVKVMLYQAKYGKG